MFTVLLREEREHDPKRGELVVFTLRDWVPAFLAGPVIELMMEVRAELYRRERLLLDAGS